MDFTSLYNFGIAAIYGSICWWLADVARYCKRLGLWQISFALWCCMPSVFFTCGGHHFIHAMGWYWAEPIATALTFWGSLPALWLLFNRPRIYRIIANANAADEELEQLRAFFNAAPCGLYGLTWTPKNGGDFEFSAINKSGEEIVGQGALEGRLLCEAVPNHKAPQANGLSVYQEYRMVAHRLGPSIERELQFSSPAFETIENPEGTRVFWQRVVPVLGEGNLGKVAIATLDITDQVAKNDLLRKKTLYDELTGAYRRGAFIQRLNEETALVKRENGHYGLLLLDIDHFKQINDTYGHLAGDAVLAELCDRIRQSCLRESDVLARLGGDEFAILLPGSDKSAAYQVGCRITEIARRPLKISTGEIRFSVSVGADGL